MLPLIAEKPISLANPSGKEPVYPDKLTRILQNGAPSLEVQLKHAWNPNDCPKDLTVKTDDPLTFHRNPIAQSTHGIRGKQGYSSGFHVWQIDWPVNQRGTTAMIGVATKEADLHMGRYRSLIGKDENSYGWDMVRNFCHHDSNHYETWKYPNDFNDWLAPSKIYCLLDMDEGTLSFAADSEYLGVAFKGLQGKTLYPIVGCVWGHCEVTMTYQGSVYEENQKGRDTEDEDSDGGFEKLKEELRHLKTNE
ncbi:hypothetical protein CRE_18736 [Caenorhabditis remanei]|uniref:B30.2/SPRY domain-containing protein n=1 Tax=Caenorhabditis remanei TaxID=31234 RepID=E3LJQ4_CAERE|nr:hypothetical protein CRE_18736 [Caenorhabditis remanei]